MAPKFFIWCRLALGRSWIQNWLCKTGHFQWFHPPFWPVFFFKFSFRLQWMNLQVLWKGIFEKTSIFLPLHYLADSHRITLMMEINFSARTWWSYWTFMILFTDHPFSKIQGNNYTQWCSYLLAFVSFL